MAHKKNNLIGQVRVLKQMVATQQAQLDEINAVIELPENIEIQQPVDSRLPEEPRHDLIDVLEEGPEGDQ